MAINALVLFQQVSSQLKFAWQINSLHAAFYSKEKGCETHDCDEEYPCTYRKKKLSIKFYNLLAEPEIETNNSNKVLNDSNLIE